MIEDMELYKEIDIPTKIRKVKIVGSELTEL
jgi:hypothetical protein